MAPEERAALLLIANALNRSTHGSQAQRVSMAMRDLKHVIAVIDAVLAKDTPHEPEAEP